MSLNYLLISVSGSVVASQSIHHHGDHIPNTAKGEKTGITVTYTDEITSKYGSTSSITPITSPVTSPAHSNNSGGDRGGSRSPSPQVTQTRSRLSKRASLVPNGGPAGAGSGKRSNGEIMLVFYSGKIILKENIHYNSAMHV